MKFLQVSLFAFALLAGILTQSHLKNYPFGWPTCYLDPAEFGGSRFFQCIDPVSAAPDSADTETGFEEGDLNAPLDTTPQGSSPNAGQGGTALSNDAPAPRYTGLPLTPGMYMIVAILLMYWGLNTIIRGVEGTKTNPDYYYYLGFLLTISAIAIGMGTAPEAAAQDSDIENYIAKIVQETGSAVWSTIAGLIIRLIEADATGSRRGSLRDCIRTLRKLDNRRFGREVLREVRRHLETLNIHPRGETGPRGADEPPDRRKPNFGSNTGTADDVGRKAGRVSKPGYGLPNEDGK